LRFRHNFYGYLSDWVRFTINHHSGSQLELKEKLKRINFKCLLKLELKEFSMLQKGVIIEEVIFYSVC